jgi:SAM-dependent methyltransferase
MPDHPDHDHDPGRPVPRADEEWDGWYADRDQVWSGEPNGSLVAEIAAQPPGRALDVGCGEGADAVWLAQRGWQVTALDVSQVALDRGRTAAAAAGVEVAWVHSGLADAPVPSASFDLVTMHYPAVPRTRGADAVVTLLRAVAPGGTLLVVYHADFDEEQARAHGFDPADYLALDDIRAGLDDAWTIEVDERRERKVAASSPGAHHTHDLVLRAMRRRSAPDRADDAS